MGRLEQREFVTKQCTVGQTTWKPGQN